MPSRAWALAIGVTAVTLVGGCEANESSSAAAVESELRTTPDGRTLVRVGHWNIQALGLPKAGRDLAIQASATKDILTDLDLDLVGILEVGDESAFAALGASLPAYRAVLPERSYTRPQGLRMGFLFKPSAMEVLATRYLLEDFVDTTESQPPLQLDVRIRKVSGTQMVTVVLVHWAPHAVERAYAARRRAGTLLAYNLDYWHRGQDVLVLGDWNDDVDESIFEHRPTPFGMLVARGDRQFLTAPLSAARVSSTLAWPELIDHHLASTPLASLATSTSVERVDERVADFGRHVSDHRPVVTELAIP